MAVFSLLIGLLWLTLIFYWAISWPKKKKTTHQPGPRFGLAFITIIIFIILENYFPELHIIPYVKALEIIGVLLCALGVAFAIWARAHLGSNWNNRPSIQENHELVTSGPYALVRHPIYTGILFAIIGSALTGQAAWLIVLVIFVAEFIRRVYAEEKLMLKEFPDQYPAYQKRTKALIPFVW